MNEYQLNLDFRGNRISVECTEEMNMVRHNGKVVARKRANDMGLIIFKARESEMQVTYDIAILRTGKISCFIGREGKLIFSDAPGLETDKTS